MLVPSPARVCSELALVTSLARKKEEGAGCGLLTSSFPFIQLLGPFLALLYQQADADSSKSGTAKLNPSTQCTAQLVLLSSSLHGFSGDGGGGSLK